MLTISDDFRHIAANTLISVPVVVALCLIKVKGPAIVTEGDGDTEQRVQSTNWRDVITGAGMDAETWANIVRAEVWSRGLTEEDNAGGLSASDALMMLDAFPALAWPA